jgi:hypothetical protein
VIDLTVDVTGADEVRRRFAAASEQMRLRLRQVVQALGLELLRKVKAEQLSGQALNVRTGRLRRSINEETVEAGDTFTSTVGTPVVYGRFWELGFDGVEQVKSHIRTVHSVFGRTFAGGVQQVVSAHARTVHAAARPFLQPALAEMKSRILERLSGAAREVLP